jgi:hypothetical protein
LITQTARFDVPPEAPGCAVCGREAGDGSGWFLVVENSWLDRLKILHWHPTLAEQGGMRSVCCKLHLKTLLIHWLTCANLQFAASKAFRLPASINGGMTVAGSGTDFVASLVGELAVYRESLSSVWTGSPQALECILEALPGGLTQELLPPAETELAEELPEFPILKLPPEGSLHYAFQNQPAGA